MSVFDKLVNKYNPMLSQMDNNGVVANPAYDPKKKPNKKKPVSPTIVDTTPKPITGGPWDDIADGAQRIHYDSNSLGLTPKEFERYTDYGVTPGPYKTKEDIDAQRANNQSAMAQIGNALGQAVGNEIVLGTVLGLSNLVDAAVNVSADEGQNDYTNPLSTAISDMQDSVRDRLAIYQENPNATWTIDDFGWWASNSVSIASTLSMLIPSKAVMSGVSMLGKLAGASRITTGLAKAAKATNLTKNASGLAKSMNVGAEIAGSAFLSRTMEGYLEARGVYEETYDKTLDRVKSMTAEQKATLVQNNPELKGLSDEDAARHISSVSADETFKNDYAMMLFDMAQFKAIGSMWKGAPVRDASNATRRLNQRAIAKLSDETIDVAKDLNFVGRLKDNAMHALTNPLKSLAIIELSEGVEEGYQAVQTEKGKEVAERILDPNFTPRNLESYLTDGAVWEQAFWGVLGGVGFQAAGSAFTKVADKLKQKPRDKMTEQEYALSQMTDEKIRASEITERQQLVDSYIESMKTVDKGLNPYEYELDPITKEPLFTDGKARNQPIASDDVDDYKSRLTNDLVTHMAISATEKGNYDLFREFVTSPDFDNYMKEAGVQTSSIDESLSSTLVRKMDDVHDVYSKSLYDILHSIDVPNGDVAKIVARNIARDKMTVQDLSVAVNELEMAMDADGRTDAENDYIRESYSNYVNQQLTELKEAKDGIKSLRDDNRISESAYNQYQADFGRRESALLSLANEHAPFSERLKQSMETADTASKADVDTFIKEFEDFYSQLKNNEPTGAPKKSLQELIDKSIKANDNLRHSEYMIPYYQEDYVNAYNNVAMQVDANTVQRYNNAVDNVGTFIEDSNTTTADAITAIMQGNVPTSLKEDVDILKIGHGSTRRFWEQLVNIEDEIIKKRRKAEAEARKVEENNKQLAIKEALAEKQRIDEAEALAQAKIESDEAETTASSTGEPEQTQQSEPEETITAVEDNEPVSVSPQQATKLVNAVDDSVAANDGVQTSMEIDERASGIATNKTFELFRNSRNLFDNLEGKDINSVEFQRILDIIAEQLVDEGVSRGYSKNAAITGIRLAMGAFYNKLNSRSAGSGDTFKRLADEIATRNRVELVEEPVKPSTNREPSITKIIYPTIRTDGSITLDGKNSRQAVMVVGEDVNGDLYLTVNTTSADAMHTATQFRDSYLPHELVIQENMFKPEHKAVQLVGKRYVKLELIGDKYYPTEKLRVKYVNSPTNVVVEDGGTTMNAVTKLIPDGEFSQVIEDFVHSYVADRGVYTTKGNKTIINIEDLFTEILNNNDIGFEQAKHIFYNLHSYINNNDSKNFVFTNRTELNRNIKSPSTFFANLVNKKSVRESIAGYMHVPTPTKKGDDYQNAIAKIGRAGEVEVGYLIGDRHNVTIKTSISIKKDGVEVGYLGSVKPNATNTGYKIIAQSRGFVYDVSLDETGYKSNMDVLFEPMIRQSTPEGTLLMNLATKQYISTEQSGRDSLTDEEIAQVLSSPTISSLMMKSEILVPKYLSTKREQAEYILKTLNSVLFFDDNAVTSELKLDSYAYWKSSTYNNYKHTHEIQQVLDSRNGKVTAKVVGANKDITIINDTNSDISLMGFTAEDNPIMIVDATGNIVSESTNTTYNNVAGFKPGTMGMLIRDNPKAPILALFTDSNTVASSPEIAKAVSQELTDSLNGFQNREISFDELYNRLANMFSGPGIDSNNLFTGYNVLKSDNRIALNIDGAKGSYNLIIHKFNKDSSDESTALTYIPNGNTNNTTYTIKPNTRFTKAIVDEIINTLKFNKTFYAVNNKNVDFDNSNRYISKVDGKLNIKIGNYNRTFNSFGEYVLDTNAFKTNQGRNANGDYFDDRVVTTALYMNMDSIQSPVEEGTSAQYLSTASLTESVDVREAIRLSGYNTTAGNTIMGDNVYNINLLPEKVFYDDKTTVALAYYRKGNAFLTRNGIKAIANDSKNLVRLLMHEHLHARIDDNSLFNDSSRLQIVDDLMGTYSDMISAVDNTIATDDKTSQNYKDATNIKKWIETNRFTPDGYFSKLSKAERTRWDSETDDARLKQFAEEWLVESLTQSTIVRYLNNIELNNELIDVESITPENKSIWQRIIDVLLQLFNKGNDTIKNNTILAKQYSILGTIEDNTSSGEDTVNSLVDLNEQFDNKVEDPLSPVIKEDQSIEQGDDVTTDSLIEGVADYQINEDTIELNDDDDFDFAVTTNIQDDIVTNDEANNVSLQGTTVVSNMDNYIQSFDVADRPLIAKMIADNQIKFACR